MKQILVAIAALALLSGCDAGAPAAVAQSSAASVSTSPADREWNTADADALSNGNVAIAAAKYLRGDELPDGDGSMSEVLKAPWNFYGKRMCFPAQVAQAEDFPPSSDVAKNLGGSAGEIVAVTEDEEIIDMMVIGGTGSISPGKLLKMCGLVAGRTEVPNRIGGTFRHLVMVGKLKTSQN